MDVPCEPPLIRMTDQGTCSKCDMFLEIVWNDRFNKFGRKCEKCIDICPECENSPRASPYTNFCKQCLSYMVTCRDRCNVCARYSGKHRYCVRCERCRKCKQKATCGFKNEYATHCHEHRSRYMVRFRQKQCRHCEKKFQPVSYKDVYCSSC